MPTTKSAIKRMITSEKRRLEHKSVKSSVRTAIKRVLDAISEKKADSIKELLPAAFSKLDKASKTGVIHSNTASRRKSRLVLAANKVLKG